MSTEDTTQHTEVPIAGAATNQDTNSGATGAITTIDIQALADTCPASNSQINNIPEPVEEHLPASLESVEPTTHDAAVSPRNKEAISLSQQESIITNGNDTAHSELSDMQLTTQTIKTTTQQTANEGALALPSQQGQQCVEEVSAPLPPQGPSNIRGAPAHMPQEGLPGDEEGLPSTSQPSSKDSSCHVGTTQSSDYMSTHASRNPLKPTIPPAHSYKKNKAGKLTQDVMNRVRREKAELFNQAIQDCKARREQENEELAKAHSKKVAYIREVLNSETHYKKTRDVSLHNAKIHYMSKKLNADRHRGERIPLRDIIKAVEDDPELQNLEKEQEEELLKDLREQRELNTKGARIDNRASNLDFQSTVSRINTELGNLSERTGAIGFAVFSRGHVNDSTFACWGDSDEAGEFFTEAFGVTPGELSRKLDAWAIARSSKEKGANKLAGMQADCAKIILTGLRNLLGRQDVHMAYTKYDEDVRHAYHVQLQGWPSSIKFSPPSTISVKSDIRLLRDALRDGECKWVAMNKQEINELTKTLREKQTKPARKQRADKGQKHISRKQGGGKRKRSNEDENENTSQENARPQKKAKRRQATMAQLPPMPNTQSPVAGGDTA